MKRNNRRLLKIVYLMIFFFIHFLVHSQPILFQGTIKDETTLKPVPDVNIKVYGATRGTSTDKTGRFSLELNKIPVTLQITCIGYEDLYYDLMEIPMPSMVILLSPKSYTLDEVDISSKSYSMLFKDKKYSVMDYEVMGDNILLILFRYRLNRSELVLLTRSGDTIVISKLPEVPPGSLFKDFLSNVHYFSKKKNAYQCFFNEQKNNIEFLYKTTVDSLLTSIKSFIFMISDRLYFQEKLANGFGTALGFYEKSTGKTYIKQFYNEKKSKEFLDDQQFYTKWNIFMGGSVNTQLSYFSHGQFYDAYEARAHQFEFYNMIYPVVKIKEDEIAFFNFSNDIIEVMNKDGKIVHTAPILFHKVISPKSDSIKIIKSSNARWRWGNTILVDGYFLDTYTTFQKNGMIKIQKIDLETGNLDKETVLPFLFPEKIEIYKGDAYFLIRSDGSNDNWKLVKCKL